MIKVVGMWEIGWNTPIMEFDLWEMVLRDFGVFGIDNWCMCPITGINKSKKLEERETIQEFVGENPDFTPVYLDENGETNLADFDHPEKVLYILGRNRYSPIAQSKQALSVRIETKENKGILWSHQALSIVLYDRMKKSWQSQ
jgi:hypothetical protein